VGERLRKLGQREDATLFMVLLAAWAVLLQRYTGQQDVVVGSPIANRNRREVEDLIGLFVNPLVLRVQLSDDPTFLDLLRQVRERALGAYMHQDLPFELLVQKLQPQRDLARNPLFQVLFVFQNVPTETLTLPDLTVGLSGVHGAVRFDLECHLWERGKGLDGRLAYNTDLFEDATIARIVHQFQVLLQDVAEHPERQVSMLRIVTDEEERQLSRAFQDAVK
jgi:non-ribosomal peptide synthetase component F